MEGDHINSWCSLWLEDKNETMDDVIKKTKEVLPLMNTMERLLEEPGVRLYKVTRLKKINLGIVKKAFIFVCDGYSPNLWSYDRKFRNKVAKIRGDL